ncbi:MAG: hypothetical protein KDI56_17825, partial [Xanthomonadales bacterium]|nr:hypothetical protein [Xanthomonadales bacterium]
MPDLKCFGLKFPEHISPEPTALIPQPQKHKPRRSGVCAFLLSRTLRSALAGLEADQFALAIRGMISRATMLMI